MERARYVPVLDGAHVLSCGRRHEVAHHADGKADARASVNQVAEAADNAMIEGDIERRI